MDEIIELIITLAGLFIYWWFTSGNFNKKKSKQVQPPSPEGTFIPPSESLDDDEEEEPAPAPARRTAAPVAEAPAPTKRKPTSFTDLLRQYSEQMEAAQRAQQEAEQERARQEAAKKARRPGTLFAPKGGQEAEALAYAPVVSYRNLEEEALRQKRNVKSVMDEPEKGPETPVKHRNPLANLLSSPEDIRKAFIMKEIFDRKHFDI